MVSIGITMERLLSFIFLLIIVVGPIYLIFYIRQIRRYSHITLKDIQACREYAATGAKLSNVTWEDIDAIMDGKR